MLYHNDPHEWPWGQGHRLWNFKLKFWSKVFSTLLLWKQLRQIVGRTLVSLVTLTCLSWSKGQHDAYFTVQRFYLISWRLYDVWTSYFGIISQYDPTGDLKINVGHCDRYFMVQWFCLISWRLFDVWTPYFGIMSQYDTTFDLKINVCHCDPWSSDFALYLEDYLIYEHHTLGLSYLSTLPHKAWFSGFWDHFPISGSYLKNNHLTITFFIASIENKAVFFLCMFTVFKVKVSHTSAWNSLISGHFRYFPPVVSGHYQR